MKKVILMVLSFILLMIASGCGVTKNSDTDTKPSSQTEEQNQAVLTLGDYFPIREDIKLIYEGQGNEFAGYSVYNDYTTDNLVQERINNGATETVKVLKITDGKLIQCFAQGETYYRMNFLNRNENPEVLLMEPLQNGTTWTLSDGRIRTITATSAQVSTSSGDYKSIEVTTTDPQKPGEETKDYYTRSVGLVKSIYSYGENPDETITVSLKKSEEKAALIQTVRFFYPDPETDTIIEEEKNVSFHTNDSTATVLEEAYKNNVPVTVLSPGAHINSLYLGEDGMVYLDMNQAFLAEMNAGSGYEGMILQSIADTFGNYFGASRVVLTVAGAPYTSGHIVMEKGDYLEVDYDGMIPAN